MNPIQFPPILPNNTPQNVKDDKKGKQEEGQLQIDLAFIRSKRFWAIVLIALSQWLLADGYITSALANFISTVAGGFTVLNSLDKFTKK